MRKILAIIFVFIACVEAYPQTKVCKRIGLVNPTVSNIEKLLFFKENNIINLDSFEIVGIFHHSQIESIESSSQFVNEHGYSFVSFELISNTLPLDSLFVNNSCTAEFSNIFRKTDAMIFLGGDDIPPKIYGEKTFLTTELIPAEQNWEISFLFHLTGGYQNESFVPLLEQRPDYLVLGICLGMQEMNVAGGGSMYQDIPFQIYGLNCYEDIIQLPVDNQHKNYYYRIDNFLSDITVLNLHRINIVKKSFLDDLALNKSPLVASVHHQAVKKLGKHYKISATSMDSKVVEALSHDKFKNVYGIQFHTDIIGLYNDSAKFQITPTRTLQLDNGDRQFHINFWKDFSKRLNEQKKPFKHTDI